MAGASLLSLIDDIASVLKDVSVLSKVAAKKTAGVLGDDLALNAEQVSGVNAERELPVIWAVAKGSMLNKGFLVPAALLISAFLPWLVTILMVIGGLYLCFEGAEKVTHKLLHSKEELAQEHQSHIEALANKDVDMRELEKEKIKGAIRTDFILSAEIIVIALGVVKSEPFSTQFGVLCAVAIAITVGVYSLVAAIVKMDDLGLYLLRKSVTGSFNTVQNILGRALLSIAPKLMQLLSIVGTAAMFLVGGGIIVHSIAWIHHQLAPSYQWFEQAGSIANVAGGMAIEGAVGLGAGLLVLAAFSLGMKLKK